MDDGLTAQTSDKNYLHSGAIAANGSTVSGSKSASEKSSLELRLLREPKALLDVLISCQMGS